MLTVEAAGQVMRQALVEPRAHLGEMLARYMEAERLTMNDLVGVLRCAC